MSGISYNKWLGSGTISKIKFNKTPTGKQCANFILCIPDNWISGTGEKKEKTEYVPIALWGRVAEFALQHAKDGDQCYVEGRLQTTTWVDQETGEKKYRTEISATTFRKENNHKTDEIGVPPLLPNESFF